MDKRVILIVMDSFGIGAMPDAASFGDIDVNTMKACYSSSYFKAENLKELGLFNIDGVDYDDGVEAPKGIYGRMTETSMGKDTTIGHWEISGIISDNPLPVFSDGFPKEVIGEIERITGRGVICNKPYSGTKVINDYGDEHVKTGALIVYTSADSVLQIAAHEEIVPLEELYEICRKCRRGLVGKYGVGRVIARPFIGANGNYTRTTNRHDFSLVPPGKTMLNYIKDKGMATIALGKIFDIFAGDGISEHVYTSGNEDGINKILEFMKKDFTGLLFANLVDYDMLYGHRRDIDGYANAVAFFDSRLPEIIAELRENDILIITADHGCDPSYSRTTDHTREYTPLLVYGKKLEPENLGTRKSFADIGASILKYLEITGEIAGDAFL